MAVVSACSTKGGVGKTTTVICLADAFARTGGRCAIIDADPNGHIRSWRDRAGDDCTVDVITDVTEKTILDQISEAAARYQVVFVDLEEVAASQAVTYAIAESDLVIIPTKVSGMDLQEVFRTYEVVQRAEKIVKHPIAARVASDADVAADVARGASCAAGNPGTRRYRSCTPEIISRAAYQAMHFTGATPSHPSGDPKAAREMKAVLVELLQILADQERAAA